MNLKGKKIFVGLSGGVDSSVSAALLLAQGADVTGVFIKGWYPPFLNCDWKSERRDAMRVAAHLGIPFLTCDAEDSYKQHVIDYMIAEYKAGRTPNPDVMCNKYVKFGTFFDFAMEHGADYIATGHYAQVLEFQISNSKFLNKENMSVELLKGKDVNKDQSYFLWAVPKEQLEKTLFPIGELEKSDVRKLASKYKLFTSEKKDSQGLCFLGKVDLENFLSHYIPKNEGDVLDSVGEKIGTHKGVHLYTLGERHGFITVKNRAEEEPLYVTSKDIESNTITVSSINKVHEQASKNKIVLREVNWTEEPKENTVYECRWRYRQELFKCTVEKKNGVWGVTCTEPHANIPLGQSLVLYAGDVCLGGGIIESVI